MTCSTVKVGGHWAIIRHSGPRMMPCCRCGEIATKQCDFPIPRRHVGHAACDKHLCEKCAVPVGPNRDYCPNHPLAGAGVQIGLGL